MSAKPEGQSHGSPLTADLKPQASGVYPAGLQSLFGPAFPLYVLILPLLEW